MAEKENLRRMLMPADPWEAGAVEQWLQEQAERGWYYLGSHQN